MMDANDVRLRAMSELEMVRGDIGALAETLGQVGLWRPAGGLKTACDEALDILRQMAERFDRKLVVTLVGPSGAGKSTLLNALAGDDALSPVGHRRPTTQQVVAFGRQTEDARQLVDQLGADAVQLRTSAAAEALANLILIDTPDTDSTHRERHIPIIHKAITLSDVLICVFDAENPKRRDHTDFMAPYVRLFHGTSLVVAVNKCDRLAEAELSDVIMPEFARYIRDAWALEPAAILCISARSRLKQPGWDADASPKHDRNQFDHLEKLVRDTFNRAGYSVDRRLENARSLHRYMQERVREEARREVDRLRSAIQRMQTSEADAMRQAVDTWRGDGAEVGLGINVRLYQQLAQRWLGPVGWLVAIWARLLVFGTGIVALLRLGHPVRQLAGAVSAIRQRQTSRRAVDAVDQGAGAGEAMHRYDRTIARAWPDIAEELVRARFMPAVRDARHAPGHGEDVGRRLTRIWNDALEAELVRVGRRLSGGWLQLLFNLPVLGVLGYSGWLTVAAFFAGTILSGDFFLHAFWTIVLVLLLSFFLLQGVIRMAAGKGRLLARVFGRVREAVDRSAGVVASPVMRQAQLVLDLAESGIGELGN